MAYKIVRNHIVEQLEIEDNGKTLNLAVDINVDSILKQFITAQYGIAKAGEDAKKATNEKDYAKAEEAMGNAVLSLFEIVFGKEQTRQIIEFYDDHTIEMLNDIAPFITEVVTPRVTEAQQKIEERYKQVSKRGKK